MKRRMISVGMLLAMLLSLLPLPTALATEPHVLTAADFAGQEPYVKTYDRTFTAEPVIQTTVNGETVTLEYEKAKFASRYVGSHDILVEGLSVSGNYQLADGFDSLTILGEIKTAVRSLEPGQAEVGKSLDLEELIVNRGTSFCACTIQGEAHGAKIQDNVLTAGAETGTVVISVYIEEENVDSEGRIEYAGLDGTTTVTITEPEQEEVPPPVDPPVTQKQPQADLSITGARDITFGETLQLSCTGGSSNGAITWGLAEKTNGGDAAISSTGLLTPTKAGTVWVTATMAGDDTWQDKTADAVPITIHPAVITIAAANKTAVMGDEVPVLSEGDYTVSGLLEGDRLSVLPAISYETTPDMTKPGEVAILVSGGAVPEGGKYDPEIQYVYGKLTIGEAYPITVNQVENGTVTADADKAPEGAVVTLTVQPAEGYVLESIKVMSGSDIVQTTEAGEGTFTFTMPDGGVLVTPVFVPEVPEELPFTDVAETDWFYESVAYVYFNGLMNGTSDTTFSPNGTTTRGMIVTILYRLAGSPEAPSRSPFQDVDPNQYYADPIAWAAWNGIVTGKTATTFGPNDPITREQMAAILYRYAASQEMDLSQKGDLTQFGDQGKISSYAREALAWANGAGLITGKGGGILDPQGPAVRAQVAAIFQRFCENTDI